MGPFSGLDFWLLVLGALVQVEAFLRLRAVAAARRPTD
jgi:hypothetical protein